MPQPADPAVAPDPWSALSGVLSEVPVAGAKRGQPARGVVKFFYGPMDCGKSTLALQMDHNYSRQGRHGLLLTQFDRAGSGRISSRIGLTRPAIEISADVDLIEVIRGQWAVGHHVDYVIIDEAQFFSPAQVEQLCQMADDAQVDVYGFGIATDFRGRLFPGAARWFELADEVALLQVEVLCWCGRPGRFNARVVDDEVVRTGDTVVVADTLTAVNRVRYQVLCRAHHRSGSLGPAASPGQLSLPGLDSTAAADG